MIKRNIL